LVGTCKSDEPHLAQYYDEINQISIPTLHIYGATDTVIPCQASFELTGYFHNPKLFFHDYGHSIPFECFDSVREFLKEMEIKFN
jgi:pimeloyl-ACP methyl ester carboxylesterase